MARIEPTDRDGLAYAMARAALLVLLLLVAAWDTFTFDGASAWLR